MTDDDLKKHLVDLELRLQTSSTRRDPAAVSELLSDGFREFGGSGRIWTRAGIVAALAAEPPSQVVSEQFECLRLSPDLALLTYLASRPGRRTLRSSLWNTDAGRWRLLFHQATIIPD